MLKTERVAALFDEARAKSADSLERLHDASKHWDRRELLRSAEQAWAAATQATNALILARSGEEPKSGDRDTFGLLLRLSSEVQGLEKLLDQYTDFSVYLFGIAISDGNLDPLEFTIHDIRQTADYIRECERLAGEAG
jgi:hypothetical protein